MNGEPHPKIIPFCRLSGVDSIYEKFTGRGSAAPFFPLSPGRASRFWFVLPTRARTSTGQAPCMANSFHRSVGRAHEVASGDRENLRGHREPGSGRQLSHGQEVQVAVES